MLFKVMFEGWLFWFKSKLLGRRWEFFDSVRRGVTKLPKTLDFVRR